VKIGIISDVHEDITRLNEALHIMRSSNIEEYVCLGDITGFGAPYYSYIKTRDANAVIKVLTNFDVVVGGNHDLYDVKRLPSNHCELNIPINYYEMNRQTRKALVNGKMFAYETELDSLLTEESEKYLRKLDEYRIKKYDGTNVLYSHYACPDITGTTTFKVNKYRDLRKHFEFMNDHNSLYSFSGHEHVEGLKIFTKDQVIRVPFNKKYKLKDKMAWVLIPALANGTNANGFVIFDTTTKEIEAIPLETTPHQKFGAFK